MTFLSTGNSVPLLRRGCLLLLPLLLVFAAGCSAPSLTATATIHPDGSFQRTLRYDGGFDAKSGPVRAVPVSVKGSKIEGYFSPPQGAAWTVSARQDNAKGREIIATRKVAVGEPIVGDLGVLTPGVSYQAERITNRATVTRIGRNRLQYREVLRWRGPLPALLRKPNPDFSRVVRHSLPQTIANDGPLTDRITLRIQRGFYGLFLPTKDAPSLLSTIGSHKSEGDSDESDAQQQREQEHWIRQLASDAFRAEVFDAAASTQANRFAASFATTLERVGPSKDSDFATFGSGPLLFHIDLPGRVVTTNGEVDAAKRRVEWELPPEAAAMNDVTLTATCDVAGAPSAR